MTKAELYHLISRLEIKRQRMIIAAAGQYWLHHVRSIDQKIDALKLKVARA